MIRSFVCAAFALAFSISGVSVSANEGAAVQVETAPRPAATENCENQRTTAGLGFVRTQVCELSSEPSGFRDAYYAVELTVEPREGFENAARFRAKSPFKSMLEALTGSRNSTSVAFTVSLSFDGYEHKDIQLLSFKKQSDGRWQSSVSGSQVSSFVVLGANDTIRIEPRYIFSRENSLDFGFTSDVLDATGVNVASPATSSIFEVANLISDAVVSANGVRGQSDYFTVLGNDNNRRYSVSFEIVNPRDAEQVYADVTMTLVGTRSLQEIAEPYPSLTGTLPDPSDISVDDVKSWAQRVSPRSSGFIGEALASSDTLEIPFEGASEDNIAALCTQMTNGIKARLSLSAFDSVLVRAIVVDETTDGNNVPDTLDRFACFDASERTLIEQYLGIETDPTVVEEDTSDETRQPSNAEIKATMSGLGAFLKTEDRFFRANQGALLLASPHRFSDERGIGLLIGQDSEPISDQTFENPSQWSTFRENANLGLARNVACFVYPADSDGLAANEALFIARFNVETEAGVALREALVKLVFEEVNVNNPIEPRIAQFVVLANPTEEEILPVRTKFSRGRCGVGTGSIFRPELLK